MIEQVNLYKFEEELYDSGKLYIAGCDEAGRGPLAGPVVVAAVILKPNTHIKGINDSKKLTEKKREELYKIIIKEALCYNIVFVSEKEIDRLNILQATKKGMMECLLGLEIKPEHALIDAVSLNELPIEHTSIIKGDAKSASIAAASILAKVSRDHYMEKMDIKYPNYGFKKHKGYCTKAHIKALEMYGPCKIHRKTFNPVYKYSVKQLQLDLQFDDDNN